MLSRFDRNNNKMIDPDEAEGPAKFFLERLAQSNPKIDLKRPVPLDVLTKEIEKMRGGGSSGGPEPQRGPAKPELLVPDFSLDSVPPMVEGFGSTSSIFNVKVEERDLKEAEERIRRYDRNNDGILSKEEIEGNRWSDDPMQYDRNSDGKISKSEMAVRYAKRRSDEQAAVATQARPQPGGDRSRGGFMFGGAPGVPGAVAPGTNARKEKQEEKPRFGDAKSYRMKTVKEKTDGTKGLPDWFARSDADGDGQVLVSEYSSSLTSETLAEFQKFDLNDDYIITAKECLAAVKNGASSSSMSSSSSSASTTSATVVPSPGGTASVDAVKIEWAKKQLEKYDKNKDGKLTVDEWNAMVVKPDGADANGDGAITVEEYAEFRSKK
jgi:Ca2+-binding EF-hand superfamily protein